jgi:hypothetical protein
VRDVLAWSFNAFDRIFFNSTLHRQCKIEIVPPTVLPHKKGQTFDFNAYPEMSPGIMTVRPAGNCCKILVSDLSMTRDIDNSSRLLIQTLLHEMIHAYFLISSCRCSSRCEERLDLEMGSTGLGTSWSKTALSIEKAMNHHFEGD